MKKDDQYTIQSVQRAIMLLRCFSPDTPELNLVQLSKMLGLHKSTIHRMVKTLESERFLKKYEGKETYGLGVGILELSRIVLDVTDIRNIAHPFMLDLSVNTGFIVALSQVTDMQKVCIERVGIRTGLQPSIKVGQITSLHIGSSGKVLLAYLDEAQIDKILNTEYGLSTHENAARKESIKNQLASIRQKGYAVGYEERVVGGAGISAPIFDHRGRILASLSLLGFSEDIRNNEEHLIPKVVTTTEQITSMMGGKIGSVLP